MYLLGCSLAPCHILCGIPLTNALDRHTNSDFFSFQVFPHRWRGADRRARGGQRGEHRRLRRGVLRRRHRRPQRGRRRRTGKEGGDSVTMRMTLVTLSNVYKGHFWETSRFYGISKGQSSLTISNFWTRYHPSLEISSFSYCCCVYHK